MIGTTSQLGAFLNGLEKKINSANTDGSEHSYGEFLKKLTEKIPEKYRKLLGIAAAVGIAIAAAGGVAWYILSNREEEEHEQPTSHIEFKAPNLEEILKNVTSYFKEIEHIKIQSAGINTPENIINSTVTLTNLYHNITNIIAHYNNTIVNQTYVPILSTITELNQTLNEKLPVSKIVYGIIITPWDKVKTIKIDQNETYIVIDIFNQTSCKSALESGIYLGLPEVAYNNLEAINKTVYKITRGEAQVFQSKNSELWRDTGFIVYYGTKKTITDGNMTIIIPKDLYYIQTDRNGRVVIAIDLGTGKDITDILYKYGVTSICDLRRLNIMAVPYYEWKK